MIQLEPNMSFDDVRQWVSNGWAWVRTKPSAPLVVGAIHKFPSPDRPTWILKLATTGETVEVGTDLREHLFPHWPACGSINVPSLKIAIHLRRTQVKQWRRTFNTRCLHMEIPRRWDIFKARPELRNVNSSSASIALAAFTPEYPELQEVLAMFKDGWASVAINRHVIITNTTPRLIYYRGDIAAKLIDGEVVAMNQVLTTRLMKAFPGGLSL